MHKRDVWELIQIFNQHRNPQTILRKYASLRKDSFAFFRGTCHLFYQDLPANLTSQPAPHVWICGDLHLENFGSYKGDDRQIYFGINDFDEGSLAPCTWDLARLVTSIFVAAQSWEIDRAVTKELAQSYLTKYANALTTGKIKAIVADNAVGIVADLLDDLHDTKRVDLLNKRTKLINDRRQLTIDNDKLLSIEPAQYQQVEQVVTKWAQTQPNPDFFEVLDIGFRIAGIGSLGLDRYLILVAGKGSPNENYLLDLKQQPSSVLQPYLQTAQPPWANSATRVLKIQQLVQSAPPALLAAIEFNDRSYLLRELQPTQDKINLKAGKFDRSQLTQLIDTLAQVTASAHLHGNGKSGSAIADDLIAFGHNSTWQADILNYADHYTDQVQLDYQDFCQAKSSDD